MVRAGVVTHPSKWPFSGYHEIQKPKKRYSLIDYNGLKEVFGFGDMIEFMVKRTKKLLGADGMGRKVKEREDGGSELGEVVAYQYNGLVRPGISGINEPGRKSIA